MARRTGYLSRWKLKKVSAVSLPEWHKLELAHGIMREPTPDAGRLVVWVPHAATGSERSWQRVSNLPGADVIHANDLCSTAATGVSARQRNAGLFSRLFGAKSTGDTRWLLPNGQSAVQHGERRNDLRLAWPATGTELDESQVRARWPEASEIRKIGAGLFLVSGVTDAAPENPPPPMDGNPQQQAEHMLAAARQAGDRPREVAALTDLGIAATRSGDARRAASALQEAVQIAQQLNDAVAENDARVNLGLALLAVGQPAQAVEALERVRSSAHAAGNRFQEKLALDHLGIVFVNVRDPARALTAYEQALALARGVGDRQHQADLLWYIAIQHAELQRRDQALAFAQEALAMYQAIGSPAVDILQEHLQKYRTGDAAAPLGGPPAGALPGALFGSWTIGATGMTTPSYGAAQPPAGGPGLLRMAISAAKSMGKFVGAGMKTVSPAMQQKRLRVCTTCEHHTGVRCKICGCFTSVKAWLPHENCPIEKWPKA
jgi:tetratricopeptide (TPR) repeat protein